MNKFINKLQLNTLILGPDPILYRKSLRKKSILLLTIPFVMAAVQLFLNRPIDNKDVLIAASSSVIAASFIYGIMEFIVRFSKITLKITKGKLVLNGSINLDYPSNRKADFIKKSDNGEFWYFYRNGVKVHTIYAAPYQELDVLIVSWLESLDFEELPE